MVFSSMTFIYYFLPLILLGYFFTPDRLKNYTLLLASLIFYFVGEPIYILLLLASVIINYIAGCEIEKYRDKAASKWILALAITVDILMLAVFKYFNFFAENFNLLFKSDMKWVTIALPIGISFYTFQIMSYIIDVYRGEVKAQKNIAYLALYVSLFPQLIAGPIVRYKTIEDEITNRKHTTENFAYGVRRFIFGLLKKVVIANPLGTLWQLAQYAEQPTVLFYWLGSVGFMLQIYFDFSAYSDMGIGLGRMFGFHFLENFNFPYVSKSITEFWQRWHMSLGTWFRDYLYIPLGGNRTTKLKWYRNIAVVWLATGIWHGAEWHFILWGAIFGVILILEKLFLHRLLERLPVILRHVYTLSLILFSFVLFNASSITEAATVIKAMLGLSGIPLYSETTLYYLMSNKILLVVAMIFSTPLTEIVWKRLSTGRLGSLEPAMLVMILIVVTGFLVDSSFNPFLYFRF
ncbi:MAG TPA: MBOAT family O-acyltransferase [Fusibacter sp.]|nr:MBOAT family O-acyltransferase [Fusibacter sp.]